MPSAPTKKAAKFLSPVPVDLVKRGLRKDTLEKWGYGVADWNGKKVQVASYVDPQGRVCGQKLRTASKDFIVIGDMKPAGLYGEWLWRDGGKMVVVTEGEIDALSVSQLQRNKWPVVSLPNGADAAAKALAASGEWLAKFESVVLMFDNDTVGKAAAVKAAESLKPGTARIARLPMKDASDMLVAGRGKEVIDAIWGAKVYRPDSILNGDDIWELMANGQLSRSSPWFHKGLDALLKGARMGEITAVVAATGAGKSTFCRQQTAHWLLSGETVGYIALEEGPRRSGLGILSVFAGTRLHLQETERVTTVQNQALWKSVKDRLFMYRHKNVPDPTGLIGKIRYMALALGAKFIVLDHLSIIASGMNLEGDERRMLDHTMTALAGLVTELEIHILLVVHLRRTEGRPHEEGKQVTLADLRGSHGISQLAFNVVALERDQQGDMANVMTVRVLKCREVGDLGVAGQLIWDAPKNQLREYVSGFKDETAETPEVPA